MESSAIRGTAGKVGLDNDSHLGLEREGNGAKGTWVRVCMLTYLLQYPDDPGMHHEPHHRYARPSYR